MKRQATAWCLVAMVVLAACAPAAETTRWGGPVSREAASHTARLGGASQAGFVARTDVETRLYNVHRGVDSVTLRLELGVMSGAVAWVLLDPHGQVRWKGQVTAPDALDRTRSLDGIPGEWKLKIALAQASGHYEAHWTSS